jgi:hypothetical protein
MAYRTGGRIIMGNEYVPIEKKKRKSNSYNIDPSLPAKYKRYLQHALFKNRQFELSVEQFDEITASDCSYCGGPGFGVDRIDSSVGYIISNCVPCCTKCNMMKHTLSVENFKDHINKIFKHQNKILK